jgi:hypothetical protein
MKIKKIKAGIEHGISIEVPVRYLFDILVTVKILKLKYLYIHQTNLPFKALI